MHPDVQNLLADTLPMLNKAELVRLTRNDIQDELHDTVEQAHQTAIDEDKTSGLFLSMNYLFYGAHQGGSLQIAGGLFKLAREAVVGTFTSVVGFFKQSEEEASYSPISH